MNLRFNSNLINFYSNPTQRIRVMSELWATENLFCPHCGNDHIEKLKNNESVADLVCPNCNQVFEIKSKCGKIGKKIMDGAYDTMVQRITSATNPDLFVLSYSPDYCVEDLTIVPKYFFTTDIIEKRNPLTSSAKRAEWVSCNILYSEIPYQGRIGIIKDGILIPKNNVVSAYNQVSSLRIEGLDQRGWLFDILNCVNQIDSSVFRLQDMYSFFDKLQEKHTDNHNVEAKIRQQLQILRDRGAIEFLGNGKYKKIL